VTSTRNKLTASIIVVYFVWFLHWCCQLLRLCNSEW